MECKKSIVPSTSRTLDYKNLNLSQKKLDEYANLYSQQLRDRVKEIKLRKDKEFLSHYFKDYDIASEGITENGSIE